MLLKLEINNFSVDVFARSRVNKFLSRHPTFRERNFTCAPDRARKKWVVKRACPIETQLETSLFVLYYLNRACSNRKVGLRPQVSSEHADAHSRPQVSREMLPVHCHAWTCLSIVALECTSPVKRFPPKTANEKNFFSTQQIQKNWTALLQRRQKQTSTLAD